MKNRFRLYRRTKGGVFYVHDSTTGKQEMEVFFFVMRTGSDPPEARLISSL